MITYDRLHIGTTFGTQVIHKIQVKFDIWNGGENVKVTMTKTTKIFSR